MKIKKFENGNLVEYNFSTLEELKNQVEEWRNKFRKINCTDKIIELFGIDRSYERYCKELDDLIKDFAEG